MTIPYGVGDQAEVFKYSLFLVFCNRVVAATIAAITLVVSVFVYHSTAQQGSLQGMHTHWALSGPPQQHSSAVGLVIGAIVLRAPPAHKPPSYYLTPAHFSSSN